LAALTASIKNLVPTDIEIRNNLMTKPLDWARARRHKMHSGAEKRAQCPRYRQHYRNSFDEMAVRITVRNQNGTAPWSVIEDVLFQNNIVRNSGGGINFLGKDDTYESAVMKRVQIINNLFENLDSKKFGADGRFITISGGEDITVANNTVFHDGNVITAHGDASRRFTFRGNILSYNNYGFWGENAGGKEVFTKYFPGGIFTDNVIVNGRSIPKSDIYVPPRNVLLDGFNAVGFTDARTGNYRLASASKFRDKKTGCDMDALEAEIRMIQK
jgi:hypothetical protein